MRIFHAYFPSYDLSLRPAASVTRLLTTYTSMAHAIQSEGFTTRQPAVDNMLKTNQANSGYWSLQPNPHL